MRFIGRSYFKLKRYNEALMWYKKAITKAPLIKNHYIEIAFLYYKLENYKKVYLYLKEALKITRTSELDFFLYDLMSLACYYLKLLPQSLIYIDKCLEISPNNKRIKNNKILIEKILNNLK